MSSQSSTQFAARQPGPRRVADVLVDVLAAAGVEVVFGLPGGTIAPVYDALLDRPDIRTITCRHETSAMFAAAGYARTSGKLGVVMVTSGPGVTNAITGLASAWCDGIPVLLIAGEVARKSFGRAALQDGTSYNLDVLGMTKSISKMAMQIREPNAAPAVLRRAIATAMSGRRGPVTLTLPVDVARADVVEPDVSLSVATSFSLDEAVLERVAGELAPESRRRVIFAGAGCRTGKGPQRLRELAEQLQIPVMTTPKGKGVFPEDHPLALGVFGIGGHPSAMRYVEGGIDVMLAIGTSLGELGTNGWTPKLIPRKSLIHVDIEATQMGKSYAPMLYIAAPAEVFLESLAFHMPRAETRAWFGIQRHSDPEATAVGGEGKITPQRALWEIQQVLPRDTVFTVDSGEHTLFAIHYLHTNSPDAALLMIGLGSMGQSIPAAIGAKLAKPRRTVAAVCGDGCFAMSGIDVGTAAAERLPIHVFVFNDQRLGMVELGNQSIFGRTPEYPTGLDVAGLAQALGARIVVVENPGDILHSTVFDDPNRGPTVFDIHIDRTATMPKGDRLAVLGKEPADAILQA